MNQPSTQFRRRPNSQRRQLDAQQASSVSQRQSSRILSRQRSASIFPLLGSFYENQSPVEQQPVKATSYTSVKVQTPIETPAPIPGRAQIQEHIRIPQIHSHHTRKRKSGESIGTNAKAPLKRARLTEKNLKAFEKMGRRGKKSTGTRFSERSTTTTNKDFGPQLQRNNVIFTSIDARAADDGDKIRELLDRSPESEPPDQLVYECYLVATEEIKNESTVQTSTYPRLSKRIPCEAEISGYGQSANYTWSEVDNHLTTGLSDAKPDLFESYRKTDYPLEAVDALSSALAPTAYNVAMPAFAVELKASEGSIQGARLKCAYDGALMTEGARAMHEHTAKPDDKFYGTAQALTIGYNGENLNFYGHHALQASPPPGPVPCEPAGDCATSADLASETVSRVEYHQYLLSNDAPRASYEDFKKAYKHTRNAQDIGYKWATERKDALWAYTNGSIAQIQPYISAPTPQAANDSLAPVSSAPPNNGELLADAQVSNR